jgi:transketolase
MMSVASGMALSGLRPVIYTIAPFATARCYEQIKIGVSYHNVPVTIIGTGSGLSYSELGPTHHSLDDIGILRLLPNLIILAPCDVYEMNSLLPMIFSQNNPVYMRIGKKNEETIYKKNTFIEIGKAVTLQEGTDLCIVSYGTIMKNVLQVSKILESHSISTKIISFHTIKPLDTDILHNIFTKFKYVVVVEEHSKSCGLFSSICEWYHKEGYFNSKIISFGADDKFMHSIGDLQYARSYYGLDSNYISKVLLKLI